MSDIVVVVQFLRASNDSFATTGMYSAVSNLGAGGTQDVSLSDTSNGVLYGMFALTGLVSGGINNRQYLALVRYKVTYTRRANMTVRSARSEADVVSRDTRLCALRRCALVVGQPF